MHFCSLTNSQMILKNCGRCSSISACKNSETASFFTIATHQAMLILSLHLNSFHLHPVFHECLKLCWSFLSSSPHFMSTISYIDPLSNASILSSPSPFILIMSTSVFPNCSPSRSSLSYVNPLLVFNRSSKWGFLMFFMSNRSSYCCFLGVIYVHLIPLVVIL
jgi:hypothetical protein